MKIFPDIDFSLPGKTVRLTDNGRVTEDDWGTYALIGGVLPASLSASPGRQAEEAFRALEAALGELGMDFSHVVRTWIYADRILTWYGELNRARDAFFREKGVYDRFVPASTGIGWTGGSGARIVLGAYAVKAKRPGALTVAALPSPLQCPALAYGSSFSRAALLRN